MYIPLWPTLVNYQPPWARCLAEAGHQLISDNPRLISDNPRLNSDNARLKTAFKRFYHSQQARATIQDEGDLGDARDHFGKTLNLLPGS